MEKQKLFLLAVKIPIFIKLGGEAEAFLLLAVGIPILSWMEKQKLLLVYVYEKK